MRPPYTASFRHGTCATHCVDCGRCMEADEPYTTEHHGDSWYDVCDVCMARRPTPCAVHYWQAVDRHEDVYRCRWCHLTWSPLDDEPGDAA